MVIPSGEREEVYSKFKDQIEGLVQTGDDIADFEDFSSDSMKLTIYKTFERAVLLVRPCTAAAV